MVKSEYDQLGHRELAEELETFADLSPGKARKLMWAAAARVRKLSAPPAPADAAIPPDKAVAMFDAYAACAVANDRKARGDADAALLAALKRLRSCIGRSPSGMPYYNPDEGALDAADKAIAAAAESRAVAPAQDGEGR